MTQSFDLRTTDELLVHTKKGDYIFHIQNARQNYKNLDELGDRIVKTIKYLNLQADNPEMQIETLNQFITNYCEKTT